MDLVVKSPSAKMILVPLDGTKDERSRLRKFAEWVENWLRPDLRAYRDYLYEKGLNSASVLAHLSTIRSRYRTLMLDREFLFSLTDEDLDFITRKALVDELIARLENAMNPKVARVRVVKNQDNARLRLSQQEANRLMRQPGLDTLAGIRDTAIIALAISTGLREAEICNLRVEDLRQIYENELALFVRDGKGAKTRFVPYGELDEVLLLVDRWLEVAGITSGYVFRGFTPRGEVVMDGKLSTRTIERIFYAYPITIKGELRRVLPHDARATYARRMAEAGMDVKALSQNMGHDSTETTWRYIGNLEANKRRAIAVYDFSFAIRTD